MYPFDNIVAISASVRLLAAVMGTRGGSRECSRGLGLVCSRSADNLGFFSSCVRESPVDRSRDSSRNSSLAGSLDLSLGGSLDESREWLLADSRIGSFDGERTYTPGGSREGSRDGSLELLPPVASTVGVDNLDASSTRVPGPGDSPPVMRTLGLGTFGANTPRGCSRGSITKKKCVV
jgi:hypothetical protein